jgi:hypothetical protein
MPIRNNIFNEYLEYHSLTRHWSPESQRFAGGDHLLVALDQGWAIAGPIPCDVYWLTPPSRVRLHQVTLRRGDETMYMLVQSNPFVDRLVEQANRAYGPKSEGRSIDRDLVPGNRWA